MGRVGIRIANAALFVLSCFLTADLINQVAGGLLLPEQTDVPQFVASPLAAESGDAGQAILDRNLFDAHVGYKPKVAKPVEVKEEKLSVTKLPLRLLGTIASDDPAIASAAIESTAKRKSEVVRIGDYLKNQEGVQVDAIERGRVILLNGSKREELKLADNVPAGVSATPRKDVRSRRRSSRRSRSKVDESNSLENRLKALAEADGGRNTAAIFAGGRALPKYEDGEMVGIELSEVKDAGFYDKVGLQDGDIVTEINGMKIDSPSATRKLFEELASAPEINAKVRGGNGSMRNIKLDSATIMDLMMKQGGRP